MSVDLDEIIGSPALLKQLKFEVYSRAALRNFWGFCLLFDEQFFKRRPFLKEVADAFQFVIDEFREERPTTITVSMPPRAGKSYITTLFCVYWITQFPELSVMRNSATYRLYKKFSKDARKILKSDLFKQVFPDLVLSRDDGAVEGWSITKAKQKSFFGHGVGGQIIGFGANLAILDDAYPNLKSALSENYNETLEGWKESDHNSRKELNCPEIYIGTRWTKKDVIGKAIESGRVDREIKIPAMFVGPDGQLYSFCENVKTTSEYRRLKEDTDEFIWEAEFMQNPIDALGLLFPPDEMKWYNPGDFNLMELSEIRVAFYDPNADGEDYFAGIVGYKVGSLIYVTGWLCNRDLSEENLSASSAQVLDHRCNHTEIETIGAFVHFGKMFKAEVRKINQDADIKLVKHETNKEARILEAAGFIKNRFVWPTTMKKDKQGIDFLRLHNGYNRIGGNKHDDSSDVAASMARWFKKQYNWYN